MRGAKAAKERLKARLKEKKSALKARLKAKKKEAGK